MSKAAIPRVGQFFWEPKTTIDGPKLIKHETRVVDDRDELVVHRRYTQKKGWLFAVIEIRWWQWNVEHGLYHLTRASAKAWMQEHWGKA